MLRKLLINLDCFDFLEHCEPVRMIFADPPDNIGLKYNGYKDSMDMEEYTEFLINMVLDAIEKCDVLWVSFNPIYTALMGWITTQYVPNTIEMKPCVQTFTFGQHNKNDLGVCHRPLWRYRKEGVELYPDAVRIPSWRQLNGDKRANPKGKVPGTVFDFPRVTGNSKQRRTFSPTQLHEGLYERCIRLCCKDGDTVVDLFAGSGTLGRVAERCGINAIMVEKSRAVCEGIAADQGLRMVVP